MGVPFSLLSLYISLRSALVEMPALVGQIQAHRGRGRKRGKADHRDGKCREERECASARALNRIDHGPCPENQRRRNQGKYDQNEDQTTSPDGERECCADGANS